MTLDNIPKEPNFAETAFNCPICTAYAHQIWYTPDGQMIVEPNSLKIQKMFAPFYLEATPPTSSGRFGYVHFSRCSRCKGVAVWVSGRLAHPKKAIAASPHPSMPADIRADFTEASLIVDDSPRASAALLRLALQKLAIHLGAKGKRIDDDIAFLVSKGLESELQMAMDIVRVIGNESVHPGKIDLNDNREIALSLFSLINLIVEKMISRPAKIKSLYQSLPEEKLEAIKDRNKRTKNKPTTE